MSKALFLLFGVVLLAQYCVARPDGAGDSDFQVKDMESLRNYVHVQVRDVAMKTIHNGKNWLEDVKEEIDNLTQKDEMTQHFDQQIGVFVAQVHTLSSTQDEKEAWDLMVIMFEKIVRVLFDVNEHDPEMKSLADLLKRNGMDAFHDQFVVDFEPSVEKVFAAVEQYVSSLSSKEKEQEENIKVIRVLNRYKTAQDYKQKFELLLCL